MLTKLQRFVTRMADGKVRTTPTEQSSYARLFGIQGSISLSTLTRVNTETAGVVNQLKLLHPYCAC